MKPLNKKAYGSIPHLPGSRLGPKDYCISEGQARIATEKKRDQNDFIIVQEKLDGSNCAVANVNGEILALTRAGYLATTSPYPQHHYFNEYVKQNAGRFSELLADGERACGEWLAMAHGTRYNLPHEPFVIFDIMTGVRRVPCLESIRRCGALSFPTPLVISMGEPFPIDLAILATAVSGHGALDAVEGAIWRVERNGEVDFLCKYVAHDKQDGKYFQELNNGVTTWNCDISKYQTHDHPIH